MDTLPTSSAPPPPPPPLPSKRGGCCCAGGCATMLAIAFITLLLALASMWYFGAKAISRYTSSEPTDIRIEAPSDTQFAAANGKLEQMRAAVAQNQVGTFEFTASDLNALIARHPNFKEIRNKVRVELQDGNMLLDASVPLATVSLPGLRKRWLNGSAKLGFAYDDGSFDLTLRTLVANGREIPISVLPAFDAPFDESVNSAFKSSRRDSDFEEFWRHVGPMRIVGDKLAVTTKAAGATSSQ